ncbi:MAG TPA: hypothetical protein VK530_10520, partial [Candidatus Acidoferrum sp.]|nr:hypothetical protein [Candidatus Acidoferrum sp.]
MKQLLSLVFCAVAACSAQPASVLEPRQVAPAVLQVGNIEHPLLTESSGLVASRRNADLFWTHNDGGGRKQVLYAMTRGGKSLAEFRVTGVLIDDWEDIATDSNGHLFLGDIGNNDAKRSEIAVHQIDEPDIAKTANGLVSVTRSWRLRFPQKPFDCESLFVWGDFGYVISKVFNDAQAELYRFSLTNT